jgi:hypothetical protein
MFYEAHENHGNLMTIALKNRMIKYCTVILLLSSWSNSISLAQNFKPNYHFAGSGARAEGLGGAFISVADDATALFWNPAGLSHLDRSQASFSSRFVSDNGDFTDPYSNDPLTRGKKTSIGQSHIAFNFGSIAIPIRIGAMRFGLALAYQRQMDLYTDMNINSSSKNARGGVDSFTPGFGINLGSVFSIGASVNFWMGKQDDDEILEATVTKHQSVNYKGSNIVAGALLDLNKLESPIPIAIGVCMHTAFNLNADVNSTNGYVDGSSRRQYHANQDTRMPFILGVGLSVHPSENIIIAVDGELHKYAETEFRMAVSEYTTWVLKNTPPQENQLRVGAEVLIPFDQFSIPVRGGYTMRPKGFQYSYGQATGNAFSFGSGLRYSLFAFDVTCSSGTYDIYGIDTNGTGTIHSTGTTVSTSLAVYL